MTEIFKCIEKCRDYVFFFLPHALKALCSHQHIWMKLPNQALKCPSAGPSSFLTIPPLFLFAPICKWDFCVGLFTECSRCWRLSGLDSHITCQSVLRQGSAMATQAPLTEPKRRSAGASQKRKMAHAHTHTYTEPLTNAYAHTRFTSEESFQCSSGAFIMQIQSCI